MYRFEGEDAVTIVVLARNALLAGVLMWNTFGNIEDDCRVCFRAHGRSGERVPFDIIRVGFPRGVAFETVADFSVVINTEFHVLQDIIAMYCDPEDSEDWDEAIDCLNTSSFPQYMWSDFLAYRARMREILCLPYGVLEAQRHKYVKRQLDTPLPELDPSMIG